jgi:hypothetical protein
MVIKKLNYSKMVHLGTVYVVKDKAAACPPSARFIPQEEFMKISLDCKKNKKDLLSSLIGYIAVHTEYFPAIPLNLLVEKYIEQNNLCYNTALPQTSGVF